MEIKFILDKKNDQITLKNITTELDKPITSFMRELSAPVKWETDLNLEEELFILENEKDYFSIYNSASRIYEFIISERLKGNPFLDFEDKLINVFRSLLISNNFNLSLLAEILNIPSFS